MRRISLRNQPLFNRLRGGGRGRGAIEEGFMRGAGGYVVFNGNRGGDQSWMREFKGGTMQN